MKFREVLEAAVEVGAATSVGLPLLAQTINTLSLCNAINPELVYAGAVKQGLTAKQIRKLKPVELGDLMFV